MPKLVTFNAKIIIFLVFDRPLQIKSNREKKIKYEYFNAKIIKGAIN